MILPMNVVVINTDGGSAISEEMWKIYEEDRVVSPLALLLSLPRGSRFTTILSDENAENERICITE